MVRSSWDKLIVGVDNVTAYTHSIDYIIKGYVRNIYGETDINTISFVRSGIFFNLFNNSGRVSYYMISVFYYSSQAEKIICIFWDSNQGFSGGAFYFFTDHDSLSV